MCRYPQALLATCLLMLWTCSAYGQRCAYSEGPVESCGFPRVIPGTPGHHVVYVDTTDSTTPGTLCSSSVTNVAWFEVELMGDLPPTHFLLSCQGNDFFHGDIGLFVKGVNKADFFVVKILTVQ